MAPVTRTFPGPAQALRAARVCGGLWCHLVSTSGNSKWWCLGQGGTLVLWAFMLEKIGRAEPWNRRGALSVTLDRDGAATFLLDECGIPLNAAQKPL